MPKPFEWEYIAELTPEQDAEIRSYFWRYGITDMRQVWRAMKGINKTYYDIIRANCEGTPIDWAGE